MHQTISCTCDCTCCDYCCGYTGRTITFSTEGVSSNFELRAEESVYLGTFYPEPLYKPLHRLRVSQARFAAPAPLRGAIRAYRACFRARERGLGLRNWRRLA